MVDANYKFIFVDVGAEQGIDAGVFSDSTLKKALTTNSLDLPEAMHYLGYQQRYHIKDITSN